MVILMLLLLLLMRLAPDRWIILLAHLRLGKEASETEMPIHRELQNQEGLGMCLIPMKRRVRSLIRCL
jgi:hypothetical protein